MDKEIIEVFISKKVVWQKCLSARVGSYRNKISSLFDICTMFVLHRKIEKRKTH